MTKGTSTGLSRIGQIAVTVHDLEAAVAFYGDTLGLPHLFTVPRMAFFDCGGVRLMLGLPEGDDEAEHRASILYFAVDDIEATHELLAGRGVEFVEAPRKIAEMPDHDLWMAFFRDMEGNALALMSEVAR